MKQVNPSRTRYEPVRNKNHPATFSNGVIFITSGTSRTSEVSKTSGTSGLAIIDYFTIAPVAL